MKTVNVTAEFPGLNSDGYEVKITESATASTVRSGLSRAVAAILKNPGLKRKRIHEMKLTVMIEKVEA